MQMVSSRALYVAILSDALDRFFHALYGESLYGMGDGSNLATSKVLWAQKRNVHTFNLS
jgi:hypothetical protein